jgi:hypothetical protein
MLAETHGVGPFQGGGGDGGGGGGCSAATGVGGGCRAATQVLDGASYTVPWPHSAALLTPGDTNVTNASGASETATIIVKRRIRTIIIACFPSGSFPDPANARILRPTRNRFSVF